MSDNLLLGVVLIVVGFVLAFVEIFVPSMGLIAAVAALTALSGVISLFFEGPAWGFTGLGVVVFGGIAMAVFGVRLLPYTPFGKGLMLQPDDEDVAQKHIEESERQQLEQSLVGAEGTVVTELRPLGTAVIEGARVEVQARSGTIEAGMSIRVVEVRGNEIFVRPID